MRCREARRGDAMTLPDDLPHVIEWRMSYSERYQTDIILTSLPRRPVRMIGSGGKTDAAIVRPQIPYGARGWRLIGEGEWRRLRDIPAHWMPFVNRDRPSEMDFRPRFAPIPELALEDED